MTEPQEKIKIKLPAEVAKIMSKWGGHQVRLAAARGALPMSGPNLVMVLFVFYHGENRELKLEALNTLKTLPANIVLGALAQPDLHASVIDLIVRLRYRDAAVMREVLAHPQVTLKSLLFLAHASQGEVLDMLAQHDDLLVKSDALRVAIINNPQLDRVTKVRLGWVEPEPEKTEPTPEPEVLTAAAAEEDDEFGALDEDDESLSKYQQLQEMTVTEKMKMALTGDKEWRTLLVREPNKQICTAVLKNPRITEGEVLTVAKNRSANEELIRLILMNKEWTKLYDMKKALVYHPRTPLQQAIKFMGFLSERDVRDLAKSKNVTQVIVTNAKRMLAAKKH